MAETQHGVVTVRQLRALGFTEKMVRARVRSGRFAPLRHGVYRVGPRLASHAREMAAVLACGPAACLGLRSAARLWGLLPSNPDPEPVEVVVVRGKQRRARPGIRLRFSASLPESDRTTFEGIPITTPLRTLIDLAALASVRRSRRLPSVPDPLSTRELEQAVSRAEREGLVTMAELIQRARELGRQPGSVLLREILERQSGPSLTRSEAEARLLALFRRAGIPPDATNTQVGPFEVDMLWKWAGLAVEVDGFRFHRSRGRFEGDRTRDAELAARGIHVLRVTWRQLESEPERLLARVARALGRAEERRPRTGA